MLRAEWRGMEEAQRKLTELESMMEDMAAKALLAGARVLAEGVRINAPGGPLGSIGRAVRVREE